MGQKQAWMGSGTSEKAFPLPTILGPSPPPPPMEDWKEDWKVTFSYLKEDPTFWSSFFHWDSGSSAPSLLLWVAEPIMAPCILLLYSHKLGSFSHFRGGWAVSLLLTSRQIYAKVWKIYSFPLSCSVSLSRHVFLFLSKFCLWLPFLSVSPVDGWELLNAHVY